MPIKTENFLVTEGQKVKLSKWPTKVKPFYGSEKECGELLNKHVAELSRLQDVLYAHDRYSFLVIFQAMDAAGKDSTIKHIMSGVNPQGCQVFSFKHPSSEELDHDFLWRTTKLLPERGRIGIFNRSYYEEVLVVKVHPEILAAQKLPGRITSEKKFWEHRYSSINNFEQHMHRNGTRILKFFLHISKDEQRRRFLKRIDEADKNWKFSVDDMKERNFWGDYMSAYENCLSETSTDQGPWYVVPADDKDNARLIVSKVIVEALEGLDLSYPKIDEAQRREILEIRKKLSV
jgi:PPK2 family polyphosphate:nucleotide phosphotransferase